MEVNSEAGEVSDDFEGSKEVGRLTVVTLSRQLRVNWDQEMVQ